MNDLAKAIEKNKSDFIRNDLIKTLQSIAELHKIYYSKAEYDCPEYWYCSNCGDAKSEPFDCEHRQLIISGLRLKMKTNEETE